MQDSRTYTRVKIFDDGKAVKCWRMKGMKENMPPFAEHLMADLETAERYECLHKSSMIIGKTDNSNWVLEVSCRDMDGIKGWAVLSEDSCERPHVIEARAQKGNDSLLVRIESTATYAECTSYVVGMMAVLHEMA